MYNKIHRYKIYNNVTNNKLHKQKKCKIGIEKEKNITYTSVEIKVL